MKKLVWATCIIMGAVASVWLKEKSVGAFPTAIFLGCLVGLASFLSKKYGDDEKSKRESQEPKTVVKSKSGNTNESYNFSLSIEGEEPQKNGLFLGKDMLYRPTEKGIKNNLNIETLPKETRVFTLESFANSLGKMCSQELIDVMTICSNNCVEFDERKLLVSTFAYFYAVWISSYGNITNEQEECIQEYYRKQFSEFNRTAFENESYKEVIENETEFEKLLSYVAIRVKGDFTNQIALVNNGVSDEFISQFIINEKDRGKIKQDIVMKVIKEWAVVASKTGQVSRVENVL